MVNVVRCSAWRRGEKYLRDLSVGGVEPVNWLRSVAAGGTNSVEFDYAFASDNLEAFAPLPGGVGARGFCRGAGRVLRPLQLWWWAWGYGAILSWLSATWCGG